VELRDEETLSQALTTMDVSRNPYGRLYEPKMPSMQKKILWKPLLCKMREIKMREIKFRAWRWSMSTRDMKELKALYGVSQSTLEACEVLLEVQDG